MTSTRLNRSVGLLQTAVKSAKQNLPENSIAHTMLSFGFEDGAPVCFSIETRNEIGEEYSALRGLFKNYELVYAGGDERDLVGLRTTHRKGEDVRLYRLH